jgi:hypothetical protein
MILSLLQLPTRSMSVDGWKFTVVVPSWTMHVIDNENVVVSYTGFAGSLFCFSPVKFIKLCIDRCFLTPQNMLPQNSVCLATTGLQLYRVEVKVQAPDAEQLARSVLRRYSDFRRLHAAVCAPYHAICFPLPWSCAWCQFQKPTPLNVRD